MFITREKCLIIFIFLNRSDCFIVKLQPLALSIFLAILKVKRYFFHLQELLNTYYFLNRSNRLILLTTSISYPTNPPSHLKNKAASP